MTEERNDEQWRRELAQAHAGEVVEGSGVMVTVWTRREVVINGVPVTVWTTDIEDPTHAGQYDE